MNRSWAVRTLLAWLVLGMTLAGLLGRAQGAWARPDTSSTFQTVPTATPLPPTPAPTAEPTPGPAPPQAAAPFLELRASVETVEPGLAFDYIVLAGNQGAGPLDDAEIKVRLPQEVLVVRAVASRTVTEPIEVGDVTVAGSELRVALGALARGEKVELHIAVQVDRAMIPGAVLECQAELLHAGGSVRSPVLLLLSPPGLLPATGGWVAAP